MKSFSSFHGLLRRINFSVCTIDLNKQKLHLIWKCKSLHHGTCAKGEVRLFTYSWPVKAYDESKIIFESLSSTSTWFTTTCCWYSYKLQKFDFLQESRTKHDRKWKTVKNARTVRNKTTHTWHIWKWKSQILHLSDLADMLYYIDALSSWTFRRT